MTKKAWGKVKPGTVVELGGREWTVDKVKPKGSGRVKVTVSRGGHSATDVLKADAKVRIVFDEHTQLGATRDRNGVQRYPDGSKVKPKPKKRKPAPRTPPKPATGDPWETQQDRIEKKLNQILGARLIGEATDVDAGYYVPEMDVTTIAAHMTIFHNGAPDWAVTEDDMLIAHAREHVHAEQGQHDLKINHWHTRQRPTTKGKKK